MPFRLLALSVLLFEAVFVLALMLIGRDPHKSARSGPSWKRKLVSPVAPCDVCTSPNR